MFRLECCVQEYAWGKNGSDSAVASFMSASNPEFDVDPSKTYAELWMGTHPSGPSKIKSSGIFLKDWLTSNPHSVGFLPNGCKPSDLPFLFKVLSIKSALSIQAHPDKILAKELNAKFPNVYKDDNHKPEMAIALTPFEALCGFRRPSDLLIFLSEYPELSTIIGKKAVQIFRESCEMPSEEARRNGYKALFHAFMAASDDIATEEISKLITRISALQQPSVLDSVILQLNIDYPNDRGILCPLLLNYITLNAGECFFMGPNEPHAYLSGNCVECMALSDNVVRAGLTPKFKDVDTLIKMLHYRNGEPSLLYPIAIDKHMSLYRPPSDLFPEFEVEKISLDVLEIYELPMIPGASIVLIVSAGADATAYVASSTDVATPLTKGAVLFVSADIPLTLNSGKFNPLVAYRAHVNLGGK